ncbi:MAG: general secretion pathway protein GspK [Sedimentisphaerales bacterium]|nr:general secretion pathway protein GspK [Sedimentisphaerales bacterium]
MNKTTDKLNFVKHRQKGIVLLVTLVILIVLSTLGYTLGSRIVSRRHRVQYIIDYQACRYACDSAVKYALATLQDINTPVLIARPNVPDFSDLFCLSEAEYQEFLVQWTVDSASDKSTFNRAGEVNDVNNIYDANDFNDVRDINDFEFGESDSNDSNDVNSVSVPGPYGPAWPLIAEPMEFNIGSAAVKIEIEDENAKYPLGWTILENKKVEREAAAGFKTFCEWMDVNEPEFDELQLQLADISQIKKFKLEFEPIKIQEKVTRRELRRRRRGLKPSQRQKSSVKTIPANVHTADFAKLFNSSIIDTQCLARPTIQTDSRNESALKYLGLWGSSKVNINTAPRHVLEAAFTFGGDAAEIADKIIERRRLEPFKDVEDIKKSLFGYSDSIDKCADYITPASSFFTIRITAISGVAEASAVIAVQKGDKKIERIAVISI